MRLAAGAVLVLAACASAPRTPVGRVETFTVQGVTLDVLVLDTSLAPAEARPRVRQALQRRGFEIDTVLSAPNRTIARTAWVLTCTTERSRTNVPCALGVNIAYRTLENGIEVRLSGIEYLRIGTGSASQMLRQQTSNWSQLQQLARDIMSP
jgi:hypothetical protein